MPQAVTTPPRFAHWLVIFIGLVSLAMSLISAFIVPAHITLLGKAYLALALPGQFLLINLLLVLPVGLMSLLLAKLKWKKGLAVAIYGAAILLVLINNHVFVLYRFHLNGMVLNLVFGGALMNNIAFSGSMWFSVFLAVMGVVIGSGILLWLTNQAHSRFRFSLVKAGGVIAIFLAFITLSHGVSNSLNWSSITATNSFIPWLQPVSMRKSLAKFGIESQNNNLSLSTRNSALNYPKSPLQCQTDKPMNIVMLVVDSLRADVLTQDVMPNSWALQPNAQMFNQHFSTGNATRYGMFGLMYGLPGNYWLPMLDERRGSALFTVTQQLGYQHFIYGSAPLTNPEFDRTVFAELKAPLHEGSHKTSDLNDQEISDAFRKELQQRNPQQPFFGLVFFDAPHAYALPDAYKHKFEPMLPSVNYMDLNNNFDPKPFFNRYKASVNYDDALIGDILKTLSQEQLLENTLVIITGDHGQEFNDSRKNFWGHNSNFTPWQTHVPLLMLWPHKPANQYTQASSHTDIVPTLLKNALGCTTPIENYSTGIDLFGTLPETRTLLIESWTERAIRHGNQLYVFDALGTLSQLDAAYNALENQPVDTLVIQQALGQMQQFKQ